jgi:hypothetical protein
VHHLARHLERLPLGTPYPDLVKRMADIAAGIVERTQARPRLFIDATGIGTPVLDLVREARVRATVTAVYFTHGDRRHVDEEQRRVSLGKAWLVSRMQALLQTGRLHLPKTPEAERLGKELLDFEIRVDQDANDRYGAFRVGTHDDLVTALGLATQDDGPKLTGAGLVLGTAQGWRYGRYGGPDHLISRNGGPWEPARQGIPRW